MMRRARLVLLTLALAFVGLAVRMFDIQILAHESYVARRDAQARGIVDVRRPRGLMKAAGGEVVAVSVTAPSIYADPRQVADPAAISRALGMDAPAALARGREFVWLRRFATEEEVKRVSGLAGVCVRSEYRRRYPHGTLLSHVVGRVDVDDCGLEGLERACESFLAGPARRDAIAVDGRRVKLAYPDLPAGGADIELTIDLAFQRIAEEELDAAVAEYRPRWAAVVAMDPDTGAILALANRPAFDPNERVRDLRALQNMAVMAPYEPGSTWKPFCVAGALEESLVTPATVIDCGMGAWKHGSRVLHDHHPYGSLTVRDVVAKSSNVGAAKIGALVLGGERLRKWACAFGFGRRTGIELPDNPGKVTPAAEWNDFTSTSVPMGHEISSTLLQLAVAMSAIANGGRLMQPYLVKRVTGPEGDELYAARPRLVRTVLSERTSAQMRDILVEVVKSGTGQKAAVEGVLVAGKTGTTQKVDPATRRYTHERHISSFVGFAPAERPRVCIAVALDEPQGAYYGGAVAAPVVANIVRRTQR